MKLHLFVFTLFLLSVLAGCMSINTVNSEVKEASRTNTMQEDMSINENNVKIGDSIYSVKERFKGNILLDQYSCVVLEAPEGYYIACIDNDGRTVRAEVKFSKDLELQEANGLDPIEQFNQEDWIGKEELAFVSQYGSCHFDLGSGLYIPSYISKTGLIYSLYIEEGVISFISTYSPKDQRTITLK